ncbi:BREX-2 system adenine-specific DNA-methyltransferase PglX [soil metagenome]
MIDRRALLATLKPVVAMLEGAIRARALSTPDIAEHLETEHARSIEAERTAMSLEEWREGEITQAAAAWVLGCVFVRFLEDNALIDQPLISGPGDRRTAALGHREEHFRAHPEHSDREYLEAVFRTVAAFPAVAPLYDESHNPLWRLGPTADGARALRETFTAIDPESGELLHDFTDPQLGTRFLGDLYQDLSETAKKRYALLQTPDFVERFILDRTLDPAIDEFGIEEVRLIDPTCGSGHFLIGAFERLFARRRDLTPGTSITVLAQSVLDQIAGVDLNPFATAITRFRLVVTTLRACDIHRLAETPPFELHLATGDSLLHGPLPQDGATMLFDSGQLDKNISHVYENEDADELKRILGCGYHSVVGNPPYIAGDDGAVRNAYRHRYASAQGLFTMNVPFMERFFGLAEVRGEDGLKHAGFVGKITGNNFLKREFGAPLVEGFLPTVDVQAVIDASGAYIPGHGTPTVLLFGRSQPPVSRSLRVVDGVRGEPTQPTDPSSGLVWTEIERYVDQPGSLGRFVRSEDIARTELLRHPLSLGIGRDLQRRLEQQKDALADVSFAIGRIAASSADDILDRPRMAWRLPGKGHLVASVDGTATRDWTTATSDVCLFPYTSKGLEHPTAAEQRCLWPHQTLLWSRRTFAKTSYREDGRPWWSWHQVATDRLTTPRSLAWGEVATHNHFIFDRGGKVFKQTAPVIKLPEGATEEEHLALLGVLNSSVACFWLKQVCQTKGSSGMGRGMYDEAWEFFFQYNATNVKDFPLPQRQPTDLTAGIDRAAQERAGLLDGLANIPEWIGLAEHLGALDDRERNLTARMISLQEELDWQALAGYGLVADDLQLPGESAQPIALGQRAFEFVLARQVAAGETETTWFERHGSTPITDVPADWPGGYRTVVQQRIALIESDPDVGLIERPEHKRRWVRAPWEDLQREALTSLVLDALERRDLWADLRPRSTADLTDQLRSTPILVEALELLAGERDADIAATARRLVLDAAVPHLAAQRLTDKGLRKREVWEDVWDLQRQEDRIDARIELPEDDARHLTKTAANAVKAEDVRTIPVPPRYAKADFRSDVYWKLRGKLDVPKERFVLIPNAERGADTSPVVGWAGWDERDLARALAGRVMELRELDAAGADRVVSLLAGVLELLPWIHQWHPESDAMYGGPPGSYFEGWLDGQLAELAVTRETLRAWRPPASRRERQHARTS